MNEPTLTLLEPEDGWLHHLRKWLLRIPLAILFLLVGASKFGARSRWISTFDQIGLGQWLRFLTGVLQICGAIAVLIPKTFVVGIITLAFTMLGAMAVWVFILKSPFNAVFPGALLVGLLVIGGEELIDLFKRKH